ncbi:hypothetical protein HZS_4621 [Henneguya salminicola]|nr:hypothetical protein HZS_4621 [Henneguya salminicola]
MENERNSICQTNIYDSLPVLSLDSQLRVLDVSNNEIGTIIYFIQKFCNLSRFIICNILQRVLEQLPETIDQ